MSKLHRKIRFSLINKYYVLLFLLLFYGWYKNAYLPFKHDFVPSNSLFFILFYPFFSFLLGSLFDKLFRCKNIYSNRFIGLLFSLCIPISTPIYVFVCFLFCLFLFHTFITLKWDQEFHFLAYFKIFLFLFLSYKGTYFYMNALEESQQFVYSFLDILFGHSVSGIFTSSAVLLLFSFLVLSFDYYYKKEIPLFSYSLYVLTLVFYSVWQKDMSFLLTHMFSSTVLFVFVFFAPLSIVSPYSKKRIAFYSFILGMGALPFSIVFNFYEGVYFSLILANLFVIGLNILQNRIIRSKKI